VVYRNGGDARFVDHQPESRVHYDASTLACDEVPRALVLLELVAERVRRPRDRERRALYLLHAVDVVEAYLLDDDRKCGDHPFETIRSASGDRARARPTGATRTAARTIRGSKAVARRAARSR